MSNENQVKFTDIATDPEFGIAYRRARSPREAFYDELKAQPVFRPDEDNARVPLWGRGAPGVAIFDYDGDGDMDMYVTNGPGTNNSLYSNQLEETGELTFVDVAVEAGVAAIDQDSTGVVAGDIDNDGDADLLVLGAGAPNRLFENQGDGTFTDITATSNIGGEEAYSGSASFGDVNGDGLLDIVVANTTDWDNREAILTELFALNQPNQLLINQGNNTFVDVSDSSGFTTLSDNLPEGVSTLTWAIAILDYDQDGDMDIIHADDQGGIPTTEFGGFDRGFIHVLNNDGTGNFTNVTDEVGLDIPGAWMGLSFGDFNGDGIIDLFGSNFGSFPPSLQDSRWFLGQSDGTFIDPGLGEINATAFGWGTGTFDYDNDGDTDIVYHGGLDLGVVIDASNPGAILKNDGAGNFVYDLEAVNNNTDHTRRNVQGVAVGDLNQDGFSDIVSVSNFNTPADVPVLPFSFELDSPLEDVGGFVSNFSPTEIPGEFVWNGIEFPDGTLSVEINSADNGNAAVQVDTLGSIGLTENGRVNRDGIGAIVSFTPEGGQTALQPIIAGGSFNSQSSLVATFGLGEATTGTLEVLWPGGVRNRLYDVQAGDRLVFPEIPVSFDDLSLSSAEYQAAVESSLEDLLTEGILSAEAAAQFESSAILAFQETLAVEQDLVFGTPEADNFDAAIDPGFNGAVDLIFTGAGADLIDSSVGLGGNRVFGGSGGDELIAGIGDRLFGGSDSDILEASAGRGGNRLYGGDGADDLIAGTDDRLFGGSGNDTLVLNALGTDGGNNRAYGGAGDDLFSLGSGDRLLGGPGNDRFFGGTGGDNLITGGAGADGFAIASAELPTSANIITDFEVGVDIIQVFGVGATAVSDLNITQEGFDTLISFAETELASLMGIQASNLIESGIFEFV